MNNLHLKKLSLLIYHPLILFSYYSHTTTLIACFAFSNFAYLSCMSFSIFAKSASILSFSSFLKLILITISTIVVAKKNIVAGMSIGGITQAETIIHPKKKFNNALPQKKFIRQNLSLMDQMPSSNSSRYTANMTKQNVMMQFGSDPNCKKQTNLRITIATKNNAETT